jgi:PadR family transcriptional regulator PadR
MAFENWQIQLRKGFLDIVILNLLNHGPSHGYEMCHCLKKIDGFSLREGNIYPILARLESEGLVISQSQPSQGGPPRKYFNITDQGRKALEKMNAHWDWIIKGLEQIRNENIFQGEQT